MPKPSKEKQMKIVTRTTSVAVLVALGLARSIGAEDWPRWHGPLGTGQAPNSPALISEAPADGLKPIWSVPFLTAERGFDGNSSSPVIADGKVYVHSYVTKTKSAGTWNLSRFAVEAIGRDKASSEAQKTIASFAKTPRTWKDEASLKAWLEEQKMAGEDLAKVLKHASQQEYRLHTVLCVDLRTGATVWKKETESGIGSWYGVHATPCVDRGMLYWVDHDGAIHAAKAADGTEVWKSKPIVQQRYAGQNSSPLVIGGVLCVCHTTGVLGFKTDSGELAWEVKASGKKGEGIGNTEDNSGMIWSHQGKQYFVAETLTGLCCIDPSNGALIWNVPGGGRYQTPIVIGDKVIRCLQTEILINTLTLTGVTNEIKVPLAKGKFIGATMPVTDGKKMWWIMDQNISNGCFDLESGKEVWSIVGRANMLVTPILADGKVISQWNEGRYPGWAMLDAATGKVLFQTSYGPDNPSYKGLSSPAISEGILVVRAQKYLYGYNLRKP
jgi:outer membrane protein assembly factor BamB